MVSTYVKSRLKGNILFVYDIYHILYIYRKPSSVPQTYYFIIPEQNHHEVRT
jgi:hypothetical protein